MVGKQLALLLLLCLLQPRITKPTQPSSDELCLFAIKPVDENVLNSPGNTASGGQTRPRHANVGRAIRQTLKAVLQV